SLYIDLFLISALDTSRLILQWCFNTVKTRTISTNPGPTTITRLSRFSRKILPLPPTGKKAKRPFWSPGILVVLFVTWLGLVCFTGISNTSYSRISFHLHRDRI
ncbi:MAG: hypothetical protein WCA04_12515, partial [Geobacteraceae bacterium]